jgi:hypothetical protein
MRFEKPLHAGLAAFATALAFYWGAINLIGHGFVAWFLLERTGVSTNATITEINPGQHRHCSYTYVVAGRTLTGHDSGCSSLGVGGTLLITYLPSDPGFATSRDPHGELAFEILAPLVLATFGGFGAALRFKERKAQAA